jgi:hypothetical protein
MYKSIDFTAWSSVAETTTLYDLPLIVVPSPGFGQKRVGATESDE